MIKPLWVFWCIVLCLQFDKYLTTVFFFFIKISVDVYKIQAFPSFHNRRWYCTPLGLLKILRGPLLSLCCRPAASARSPSVTSASSPSVSRSRPSSRRSPDCPRSTIYRHGRNPWYNRKTRKGRTPWTWTWWTHSDWTGKHKIGFPILSRSCRSPDLLDLARIQRFQAPLISLALCH